MIVTTVLILWTCSAAAETTPTTFTLTFDGAREIIAADRSETK
jgi:hypothetical protein